MKPMGIMRRMEKVTDLPRLTETTKRMENMKPTVKVMGIWKHWD
jgi:hypothetical protein